MNQLHVLANKAEKLATGFEALPTTVVRAMAAVVKRSVDEQIGKDAPRRRVAGGRVGVTVVATKIGHDGTALVKATGPLHLLANPTAEHQERARRKRALRTPYGPRYSVEHPGTKGKDTWHKGVDKARPLVSEAADAAVARAIGKALA